MRSRLPKDRRPLGAIAGVLAVVAATAGIITTIGAAHADTTSPTLRASLAHKKQWVVLHWKFETDSKRQRDRVLEVQRVQRRRRVHDDPHEERRGPQRSITDKTPFAGPAAYRARVKILGGATAETQRSPTWSNRAGRRNHRLGTGRSTSTRPRRKKRQPRRSSRRRPPRRRNDADDDQAGENGITPCPESYDTTIINETDGTAAKAACRADVDNAKLNVAANARSVTLASQGHLDDHVGPHGYIVEVNAAGYYWSWIGENIHAYVSLAQLVAGWMASPPHIKENMLATHFHDLGSAARPTHVVCRGILIFGLGG